MAIGDEVEILGEPFNASARPTPSAEEREEKLRKSRQEHTNNQRPAPGDTPQQLGEKLCTLAYIQEPEPVHTEIIQQLLDLGADVNHVGKLGRTPIIAAANAPNAPLVTKLLAKGADPNIPETGTNDGSLGHAICYAAYSRSPEVIRLLLQAGADPNARTNGPDGRTALILAIDYARVKNETAPCETVIALVEGGASPNLARTGGFTPLLYTINSQMPETAKYLLAHGADPELKIGDKASPAEAASWREDESSKSIGVAIAKTIAARRETERLERENREHLDQWMKDGCPAEAGAKTMPPLKLKTRSPVRS